MRKNLVAFTCDVCGQVATAAPSHKPEGWEKLRVPRTIALKRKGKSGRTHTTKISSGDCCRYCVNAFHALADARLDTGNGGAK